MKTIKTKIQGKTLEWEAGVLTGDKELILKAEALVQEGAYFNPWGITPIRVSIADVKDLEAVISLFFLLGEEVEIISAPQEVMDFLESLEPDNEEDYLRVVN